MPARGRGAGAAGHRPAGRTLPRPPRRAPEEGLRARRTAALARHAGPRPGPAAVHGAGNLVLHAVGNVGAGPAGAVRRPGRALGAAARHGCRLAAAADREGLRAAAGHAGGRPQPGRRCAGAGADRTARPGIDGLGLARSAGHRRAAPAAAARRRSGEPKPGAGRSAGDNAGPRTRPGHRPGEGQQGARPPRRLGLRPAGAAAQPYPREQGAAGPVRPARRRPAGAHRPPRTAARRRPRLLPARLHRPGPPARRRPGPARRTPAGTGPPAVLVRLARGPAPAEGPGRDARRPAGPGLPPAPAAFAGRPRHHQPARARLGRHPGTLAPASCRAVR